MSHRIILQQSFENLISCWRQFDDDVHRRLIKDSIIWLNIYFSSVFFGAFQDARTLMTLRHIHIDYKCR